MSVKKSTKRLLSLGKVNRERFAKKSPSRNTIATGLKAMRARFGSKKARNKYSYGKGYKAAQSGSGVHLHY